MSSDFVGGVNRVLRNFSAPAAVSAPKAAGKLPSWVKLDSVVTYISKSRGDGHHVRVEKIDDKQQVVTIRFEEDRRVWKKIPFSEVNEFDDSSLRPLWKKSTGSAAAAAVAAPTVPARPDGFPAEPPAAAEEEWPEEVDAPMAEPVDVLAEGPDLPSPEVDPQAEGDKDEAALGDAELDAAPQEGDGVEEQADLADASKAAHVSQPAAAAEEEENFSIAEAAGSRQLAIEAARRRRRSLLMLPEPAEPQAPATGGVAAAIESREAAATDAGASGSTDAPERQQGQKKATSESSSTRRTTHIDIDSGRIPQDAAPARVSTPAFQPQPAKEAKAAAKQARSAAVPVESVDLDADAAARTAAAEAPAVVAGPVGGAGVAAVVEDPNSAKSADIARVEEDPQQFGEASRSEESSTHSEEGEEGEASEESGDAEADEDVASSDPYMAVETDPYLLAAGASDDGGHPDKEQPLLTPKAAVATVTIEDNDHVNSKAHENERLAKLRSKLEDRKKALARLGQKAGMRTTNATQVVPHVIPPLPNGTRKRRQVQPPLAGPHIQTIDDDVILVGAVEGAPPPKAITRPKSSGSSLARNSTKSASAAASTPTSTAARGSNPLTKGQRRDATKVPQGQQRYSFLSPVSVAPVRRRDRVPPAKAAAEVVAVSPRKKATVADSIIVHDGPPPRHAAIASVVKSPSTQEACTKEEVVQIAAADVETVRRVKRRRRRRSVQSPAPADAPDPPLLIPAPREAPPRSYVSALDPSMVKLPRRVPHRKTSSPEVPETAVAASRSLPEGSPPRRRHTDGSHHRKRRHRHRGTDASAGSSSGRSGSQPRSTHRRRRRR
mmetsp:Transcript_60072/g.143096  ORF Transcript_60072/g.143096 Transcript_60072/m.143096 type:complete len:837 (+) Transcript_60072:73-2583(+)